MKSLALVDTDGGLCSQQFLPKSQSKNVSPPPKLGAGLEQMSLKQDGCSSPGMNLTSHPGMWSSSVSSHTEMSQDNVSRNPVHCLSVVHTEMLWLLQASDEVRKDMTLVSSVDAFSEPVQMNCS